MLSKMIKFRDEIKNKSLVRMINKNTLLNAYRVGGARIIIFSIIWIGILYILNIKYGVEVAYCEDTILRSGNTITIIKDDGTIITKVVKEAAEQKMEEFPIWIRIIGMAFSACLFIIIVPIVIVIYAVTGVWLG